MAQSISESQSNTPREFTHRSELLAIFARDYYPDTDQDRNYSGYIFKNVYDYLPGKPFRCMKISEACRMSLKLVKLLIMHHPNDVPNIRDHNTALSHGKVDIAKFLSQNCLPNVCYTNSMLRTAINNNDLEAINYVEDLYRRHPPRYRQQPLLHGYNRERLPFREKILVVRELRTKFGLPPALTYKPDPKSTITVSETDPETTIPASEWIMATRDYPIGWHLKSFALAERALVSGIFIALDAPLTRIDRAFQYPDGLACCKYYHRRFPSLFNTITASHYKDTLEVMQSIVHHCIDTKILEWLLDFYMTAEDINGHGIHIARMIAHYDRADILKFLEDKIAFSYYPEIVGTIGASCAVKVFDHYFQNMGFTPIELGEIFRCACSAPRSELYFELLTAHEFVPTVRNLESAITRRADLEIIQNMMHVFNLRTTDADCYSVALLYDLYPVIKLALEEHPGIFTRRLMKEVLQSFYATINASIRDVLAYIARTNPRELIVLQTYVYDDVLRDHIISLENSTWRL